MNLIILKTLCSSSQHCITFMSQLYYKHHKTSEKVPYSEDHLHILIWQKLLSKSQCFTTSIFYFSFSAFLTVGNGYKLQFTLVVSSKIIQTAWQIKGNNETFLQSSESYNVHWMQSSWWLYTYIYTYTHIHMYIYIYIYIYINICISYTWSVHMSDEY